MIFFLFRLLAVGLSFGTGLVDRGTFGTEEVSGDWNAAGDGVRGL